jgi:hypothetical protein
MPTTRTFAFIYFYITDGFCCGQIKARVPKNLVRFFLRRREIKELNEVPLLSSRPSSHQS